MPLALRTLSEHRSFEAACLGIVDSRPFMPHKDDELRPVMLTFACSSQLFRPFLANIWEKRPLELHYYQGTRLERVPVTLLKSAGYSLAQQVVGDSIVGTFYLTNAFTLEPPNTEDERCDFIMLPTREQLEDNAKRLDNRAIITHLHRTGRTQLPAEMMRYFGALACLWAGYVDRRVHAPMIQEPAFFAQAFYDALKHGLASVSKELSEDNPVARSSGYSWRRDDTFPPERDDLKCYGLEALGYAMPAVMNFATEERMQALLADSLKSYSAVTTFASGAALPEDL